MIRLSLTDNFSLLDRLLHVIERDQMPFAIARALTDMAQLGKATVTHAIPEVFAKGGPPKAFTVNSVVARPATKSTMQAMVFLKDKQAKYLELEELGGTRTPEKGALVLPGSSTSAHDPHGNLPEGTLRKLRAAAKRAGRASARRAKAKLSRASKGGVGVTSTGTHDAGVVYFSKAGPHGRGTGGYYERTAGGHLRRLTGFEGKAEYKPIFHYHERIRKALEPAFAPALMRRLNEAIASR